MKVVLYLFAIINGQLLYNRIHFCYHEIKASSGKIRPVTIIVFLGSLSRQVRSPFVLKYTTSYYYNYYYYYAYS